MIAELQPGEGYMKYKSIQFIDDERRELSDWFDSALKQYGGINDLAKAAFDGDADALAKADAPDLRIAKADLAEMRAEYGDKLTKDSLRSLIPGWRLAKIMRRYTDRTVEINEDERRSRRLNEAWTSLPPLGPWSTVH